MIRRPSSSPPAAPARPRACCSPTAISTPRWSRSAISTYPARRDRLACFPLFGLFNCAMGVDGGDPRYGPVAAGRGRSGENRRGRARLERDPGVRLAGGLGPRGPATARRTGSGCRPSAACCRPARPIPAEVLRRMRACIHPQGEVHTPYGATEALPVASISAGKYWGRGTVPIFAARAPRFLAVPSPRKWDCPRHGAAAAASARRMRRAAVLGRPLEGDPHRRWSHPVAGRGGRVAARRDRRADRQRAASHAGVRHPDRVERPGKDRRRSRGVAPDGRLRLSRPAGAVLVLRAGGAPCLNARRPNVHDLLRGDLQRAPAGPPQRTGRRWPRGPAAPGDRHRAARRARELCRNKFVTWVARPERAWRASGRTW